MGGKNERVTLHILAPTAQAEARQWSCRLQICKTRWYRWSW